jgi:hypothetical protein
LVHTRGSRDLVVHGDGGFVWLRRNRAGGASGMGQAETGSGIGAVKGHW